MKYQKILEEICDEVLPLTAAGRVADYIPPLASMPRDKFGMSLRTVEGELASVGDAGEAFSLQSVAKVFLLTIAMRDEGDAIWSRVGREPSGSAFNSLVLLEHENGIPRNPFINAGALVIADIVLSNNRGDVDRVLEFAREVAGSAGPHYDLEVAAAESATGHRNRAVAHFLKSYRNLRNDVDDVLEMYFRCCSLTMSCDELATAFSYLASGGVAVTGNEVATPRQVKRINSIMLTCGVYDEAGDFAYRVGLPCKSGVGGGIAAVLPGRFSVAVWSPGLDRSGNSLAGTMALELLTTKAGQSIF